MVFNQGYTLYEYDQQFNSIGSINDTNHSNMKFYTFNNSLYFARGTWDNNYNNIVEIYKVDNGLVKVQTIHNISNYDFIEMNHSLYIEYVSDDYLTLTLASIEDNSINIIDSKTYTNFCIQPKLCVLDNTLYASCLVNGTVEMYKYDNQLKLISDASLTSSSNYFDVCTYNDNIYVFSGGDELRIGIYDGLDWTYNNTGITSVNASVASKEDTLRIITTGIVDTNPFAYIYEYIDGNWVKDSKYIDQMNGDVSSSMDDDSLYVTYNVMVGHNKQIYVKKKAFEINTCTHSNKETMKKNVIDSTCTKEGSYDEVIQCKDCGKIVSSNTITIEKKAHTYTMKYDSTYHFKQCSCGKKINIEKHTNTTSVLTEATLSSNGKLQIKCSTCHRTTTSTIYKPSTFTLSTSSYTYNGNVKNPSITIKNSKGQTISSSYYSVTKSSGRKYVGKYTYKITFKGRYSGTKSVYFKILPKKTSIVSITSKSKGFTVKWSKVSSQCSGYQIQYSTTSGFTKDNHTRTIPSYKTVSSTFNNLKAKKKYYVRVRTYKTVSKIKYYSAYCTKKYVTTKA